MWPLAKGGRGPATKTPKKSGGGHAGRAGARDPTVAAIRKLEKKRSERRRSASEYKQARSAEERRNERMGRPGDVDFQRMIKKFRREHVDVDTSHSKPGKAKITICVRKRPVNSKEVARKDWDSVSCLNPKVYVHTCKLKVDGITKYLDNQVFAFDHTFGEDDQNEDVYVYTVQPQVAFMFKGGNATCFAYGQTGSGKTYTMSGIEGMAARDIFRAMDSREVAAMGLECSVSFFEIYGGRCLDLLHQRKKVQIREDAHGRVQAVGLKAVVVNSSDDLLEALKRGNKARTTHATATNSVSSRSHAICEILLRDAKGNLHGKLSLIDLAGSERAVDTKSHNRQRRLEGAEINKSLLALKECIRALGGGNRHVPYRASKLTLVLKDSFTSRNARVCMIATVSPCASNADHTGNTLRYADRVKERDHRRARAGDGGVATLGFGIGVASDDDTDSDEEDGESPVVPEPSGGGAAVGGAGRAAAGGRRAVGGYRDGPPLSPTAEKLAAASRAAKEGRITPEEKGRIKDSILRAVEKGADPAVTPRADKWVTRRRDSDSDGEGALNSPPLASPIASKQPQTASFLSRPGRRSTDSTGARRSTDGTGRRSVDGSGRRRGQSDDHRREPPEPVPARRSVSDSRAVPRMSRAASEQVIGRGVRRADAASDVARERASAAAARRAVSSDGRVKGAGRDGDDGNWFGLGSNRERAGEERRLRHGGAGSFLKPGKALGELVLPDGVLPAVEESHTDSKDAPSMYDAEDLELIDETEAGEEDPHEVEAERRRAEADLQYMHRTMRERGEMDEAGASAELLDFHEAVSMIVQEEETLLNAHMSSIQEHASLLEQEGRLLTKVQGDDVVDYDIDSYAEQLDGILARKLEMCQALKNRLSTFRSHLAAEEQASKRVGAVPSY